jgi:hypothetical protein
MKVVVESLPLFELIDKSLFSLPLKWLGAPDSPHKVIVSNAREFRPDVSS